jgi:hypothetical protein
VRDATCQHDVVLFDGLDLAGKQGIYVFDAGTTGVPRLLRAGSYSFVGASASGSTTARRRFSAGRSP